MSTREKIKPAHAHIPPAPDGAERQHNAKDEQDLPPESAHSGKETTGHSTTRKRNKPGPKKKHPRSKANWMPNKYGQTPYTAQVNEYLTKTEEYYQPITRKERYRKFHLVADTIVKLGAPNNILKWTRQDILRWKRYIEDRIQNSTKVKYWRCLKELLEYYKNDSLRDLLREREIRMPQVQPKEIRSLTLDDVEVIHEAAKKLNGWDGDIARFVTMMYPYTGLRPSELRTEKLSDVNTHNWTLVVSFPKGSKSYGRKRTIPIPTPARQPLLDFLVARRKYLTSLKHNPDVDVLIPYKSWRNITAWPDAQWRLLKGRLDKRTHVNFSWKDYRSTFCQWAIDRGASLQSVSKIMGHSTSRTTELHYGRIKDSRAIEEINRILSEPVVASNELTREFGQSQ